MKKIAVLTSGGGTNLNALIKAQNRGIIKSGKIELVIASDPNAYSLTRAREASIPTYVVTQDMSSNIHQICTENQIDLIVLAGFMFILGEPLMTAYKGRMINIHPSLIPAFSGKGYYGLKVHKAALEYGVKITGATVHYVNEVVDGGQIIIQKAVEVLEDDTPLSLQKRVMEQAEWQILPQAVEQVLKQMG